MRKQEPGLLKIGHFGRRRWGHGGCPGNLLRCAHDGESFAVIGGDGDGSISA